ncbi:MAG: hypothetical protein AVDCRST_MAG10-3529, partial [uncultured Acidimicrobiales bacterium]
VRSFGDRRRPARGRGRAPTLGPEIPEIPRVLPQALARPPVGGGRLVCCPRDDVAAPGSGRPGELAVDGRGHLRWHRLPPAGRDPADPPSGRLPAAVLRRPPRVDDGVRAVGDGHPRPVAGPEPGCHPRRPLGRLEPLRPEDGVGLRGARRHQPVRHVLRHRDAHVHPRRAAGSGGHRRVPARVRLPPAAVPLGVRPGVDPRALHPLLGAVARRRHGPRRHRLRPCRPRPSPGAGRCRGGLRGRHPGLPPLDPHPRLPATAHGRAVVDITPAQGGHLRGRGSSRRSPRARPDRARA